MELQNESFRANLRGEIGGNVKGFEMMEALVENLVETAMGETEDGDACIEMFDPDGNAVLAVCPYGMDSEEWFKSMIVEIEVEGFYE